MFAIFVEVIIVEILPFILTLNISTVHIFTMQLEDKIGINNNNNNNFYINNGSGILNNSSNCENREN